MTLHTRKDGAWAKVNGLFVRRSGVWTPVKNAYVRDGGVWKVYYTSEIVVNVTASQNFPVMLANLFSSTDWQSDTPKRVVIQSGVVISGETWGAVAAQSSAPAVAASWGGTLTLDNYGIIQGVGGAANGGVGGQAIHDNNGVAFGKKVIVNNYGTIRSGGGGGGKGGTGSAPGTLREPATGFTYNASSYYWDNSGLMVWEGINKGSSGGRPSNNAFDGWTYYRGTLVSGTKYSIARSIATTVATVGGDGGRGVGSDGAAAAGTAGGTNAGTGGAGGDWGANGSAGAAGNTGSGAAGGLAGIAYTAANWSVNNQGTIQGRVL